MSTPATMWKDLALVEVHIAVMHSYQVKHAKIYY
jgi:nitric oxide synthase oxygenase domain/subunit